MSMLLTAFFSVFSGLLLGAATGAKFGHEWIADTVRGDFQALKLGIAKVFALMVVAILFCLLGHALEISLTSLFSALRMPTDILLPTLAIGALGMAALGGSKARHMIQEDLYIIGKSFVKLLRLLAIGFAVWINVWCVLVLGLTVVIPFLLIKFLLRGIITTLYDVKNFFFEPLGHPQQDYNIARALAKKEGHKVCESWARVSICSTNTISDLDLNLYPKPKPKLLPEPPQAMKRKRKQKNARMQLHRAVTDWQAEFMKQQERWDKEAEHSNVGRRKLRMRKRLVRRASFCL